MHGPILMSRENPTGYKLEDLLRKLRDEIEQKSNRIKGDPNPQALLIRNKNAKISLLLREAEHLQREVMGTLDVIGIDQGPTGRPRIGAGQ